jgi:hypothetical protein
MVPLLTGPSLRRFAIAILGTFCGLASAAWLTTVTAGTVG